MSKTRIAVAGAGYIGLAHMAVAQKSPTCTLAAVVDPAPAAVAFADKAGVPLYKSLDELTMRLKTYPRTEDRSWWKPFEVGVAGMVRDNPLKHQMEHFGAVVRKEAQPLVSARDDLANLRITEAIVEAAKIGQVVETTPH